MKDITFRVAMKSILGEDSKSKSDLEKILFKSMDLIKSKKIRDTDKFYSYLEEANVSKKEFADTVTDIIKKTDKPERIIQLGLFLGKGSKDSGLDLLNESWWERNLPDDILKKSLSPKWWVLFRDNIWLERNKVTRN